jgi:hypothetical protein
MRKITRNMVYDAFRGVVLKIRPLEYGAGMEETKPRHSCPFLGKNLFMWSLIH